MQLIWGMTLGGLEKGFNFKRVKAPQKNVIKYLLNQTALHKRLHSGSPAAENAELNVHHRPELLPTCSIHFNFRR